MKKLIVALTVLLATTPALAQETGGEKQPTPEELKQIMEMSFGAMVPMMGQMTEAMIDAQLKIGAKPDTAKKVAQFKRNLYNELVRQGFSKKEALDITINTSLPAAMPGLK